MTRIVLASGSPRRREILEQVGMNFEIISSDADENTAETKPDRTVEALSCIKAEDIFDKLSSDHLYDNTAIIGADTIVSNNGIILGKPTDTSDAFNMLKGLQGNTHDVYTGITIIYYNNGQKLTDTFSVRTKVDVLMMTDEQIYAYIATKEPMDKAGSYGIQGAFAAYISGIEGDYYNVVGLPVSTLLSHMRTLGINY